MSRARMNAADAVELAGLVLLALLALVVLAWHEVAEVLRAHVR